MPPKTALDELGTTGAFVRTESKFRNHISAGSEFPPEKDRYILIISYACPWASRTLMSRALKGLEFIPVYVVSPVWSKTKPDQEGDDHRGWIFDSSFPAATESPKPEWKTVRDVYESQEDPGHKFSVPVLFDIKTNKIVNNESSEILRMFDTEFDEVAGNPKLRLYPEALRPKIDEINEWVYKMINNGVYRAGFATKQEPYDEAVTEVFDGLARVEAILSTQRYLVGNRFTEADVRLFVTLVRFDEVYTVHFKCNKARISDFPNTTNYIREIYQMPGIRETVNMPHIKNHYYRSHPQINPFAIVAAGPEPNFDLPHDRAKFPAEAIDQ